jgi:RNA polymerase sigma-70 factor (ECF subfamily)
MTYRAQPQSNSPVRGKSGPEAFGAAPAKQLCYERFCADVAALVPALRRRASRCCGASDALDLVQITCERALSRWHQWSGNTPLEHWVGKIFTNALRDHWRSSYASLEATGYRLDEVVADSGAFDNDERVFADQVIAAIQGLPGAQRQALMLVAFEGMTYSEAAEALIVPLGTVMSRLARAREALRAKIVGAPRDAERR